MIPFQEYDLRQMLENQFLSVNKKIDSMSNEEIMANDLEVIAENLYQEFFVEPITLQEEDFAKRKISQVKLGSVLIHFIMDYIQKTILKLMVLLLYFVFRIMEKKSCLNVKPHLIA